VRLVYPASGGLLVEFVTDGSGGVPVVRVVDPVRFPRRAALLAAEEAAQVEHRRACREGTRPPL
jgi:hypothetical protein